jgi:hypothetical protein
VTSLGKRTNTMAREELGRLERLLLVHLLEHRGNQVRFEADQWTTEFGIMRKFAAEDPATLKNAVRLLEMSRLVYRRTQYVVGYSEPKHVLSLTATGHRAALEVQRSELTELAGDVPGPGAATAAEFPGASGESRHARSGS